MARPSAAGRSRKPSEAVVTGGPGSVRARLRLGVVVLLALMAALWAVLGLRLLVAPPGGIASSLASVIGLFYLVDALVYALSARWVAVQKRWGHVVAIAVVAINLLLGFTTQMTGLEWVLLGVNVVTLGLLIATVPRRR